MLRRYVLSALFLAFPANLSLAQPLDSRMQKNPEVDRCKVDVERMMRLSPDQFDQDMQGGWRPLAAVTGCEQRAADLITTYIARNWGRISQVNLHALYWHAGQMEAIRGQARLAIPLLLAGVNPERKRQEIGFYEYALGTVAFLDHDLAALKAARQRLSVLPRPDWYDSELAAKKVSQWPANLSVLDNLVRCFDAPYSIAYTGECSVSK